MVQAATVIRIGIRKSVRIVLASPMRLIQANARNMVLGVILVFRRVLVVFQRINFPRTVTTAAPSTAKLIIWSPWPTGRVSVTGTGGGGGGESLLEQETRARAITTVASGNRNHVRFGNRRTVANFGLEGCGMSFWRCGFMCRLRFGLGWK